MPVELKPCPFCGFVPTLEDFRRKAWGGTAYQASCPNCSCFLGSIIIEEDGVMCAALWNQRANIIETGSQANNSESTPPSSTISGSLP